jgi:aminopeptidase N
MLGDEVFKKALHTYMDNWNGKHPIPWDYFNSMSTGSGKNLNWFFNNWFFTNYYDDLAIDKVTPTAKGVQVDVKNVGGFAIPFDVVATYADGTTKSFHQTPVVWEHNQKAVVITLTGTKEITGIKLDNGIYMDADESNNSWKK